MIYLKWLLLALLDLLLLVSVPFVVPVLSLFTRAQPDLNENGKLWGGWYGTWDNPPQGDSGWVNSRSPFPHVITGWKGYVNRVMWLFRNPLYNFQRSVGIPYEGIRLSVEGRLDVSDKHKRPGSYFVKAFDSQDRLVGFEFYAVWPWAFGKCLRVRLGWKLLTDKFERYSFAPLVDTINPFKTYGDQ